MTIHITGDTHSDVSRLLNYNKIKPNDTIMLWRRNDYSKIERLEQDAITRNIMYLFCDGNHENFKMLEECPEEKKYGGRVGKISEHIYHLKRGEVYTSEGKTFFV